MLFRILNEIENPPLLADEYGNLQARDGLSAQSALLAGDDVSDGLRTKKITYFHKLTNNLLLGSCAEYPFFRGKTCTDHSHQRVQE